MSAKEFQIEHININRNMKKFLVVFIILILSALTIIGYKTLSISELQKSRTVDGTVEPVFTQDCFPRTLERNGVTKKCFERANLGQNIFCTKSELTIIEDYYKIGQSKDPLNGSGQFCAEE